MTGSESSLSATITHCPYCALQCGMQVAGARDAIDISGNFKFPVNKGGLCIKGWAAGATLAHPDRLQTPVARDDHGTLVPVSWDAALDSVARGMGDIQNRYGPHAVGVFGGGSLTNEKVYLLGKFARVALGTSHIDYNGRFCMSSAAAAATSALGLDRGLPFPLADIAQARAILLVGGNVAETMPPIMQYFEAQLAGGGQLIVIDPRRTATARWATRHLRLRPGSDAALANGLLHILIRDELVDADYTSFAAPPAVHLPTTRASPTTDSKTNRASCGPVLRPATGVARRGTARGRSVSGIGRQTIAGCPDDRA